jgi:predicted transcriptional regulator of viral defense system
MTQVEIKKYAEASVADDELKVERCRRYQIGADKLSVLDAIFKLKVPAITKTLAGRAYDLAEQRVDCYGSPRTAWGYAGGLTEIARDLPNANDRHALDTAATRVMEMAF